jgi:hypothetical protein
LAVDHHHPLRAFAPLGFADAKAPFLAGAKLPSRKLSLQSSLPLRSSSERNARQILSQTPCFSQRRNRRQQVLALGYSGGKSRHRAPVLSTHKMPSTTRRLSDQGRPRLLSRGSNGSILFHRSSLKNGFGIHHFSQIPRNWARIKYLHRKTYETTSSQHQPQEVLQLSLLSELLFNLLRNRVQPSRNQISPPRGQSSLSQSQANLCRNLSNPFPNRVNLLPAFQSKPTIGKIKLFLHKLEGIS